MRRFGIRRSEQLRERRVWVCLVSSVQREERCMDVCARVSSPFRTALCRSELTVVVGVSY